MNRDELTAEVVAEVRAILADLKRMACQYNPVAHPEVVIEQFSRLLALLELSPGERAFIQAAADEAVTGDFAGLRSTLEIFADWLEDAQRIPDAGTVRKLSPRSGDILVLTLPEARPTATAMQGARDVMEACLADLLGDAGQHVFGLVLPGGYTLEKLHADSLRDAGWMRTSELDAMPPDTLRCLGLMRASEHDTVFELFTNELAGEPEGGEIGKLASQQVLNMIRRLKRENRYLQEALSLSDAALSFEPLPGP